MTTNPTVPEEPEWLKKLNHELLFSKMTHNFTLSRDELIYLIGGRHRERHEGDAVPDNELPGMWETADFQGGKEESDDKALRKQNERLWLIGKALNPEAKSLYWDDITEAAIRVITQALRPTTHPPPPSIGELLEKAKALVERIRDGSNFNYELEALERALLPQEPKEEGKS